METITLGPFLVGPDGALRQRIGDGPPVLRFHWRGRACEAVVTEGWVQVAVLAGRVPSTAEGGTVRRAVLATLAALPRAMPKGWRLRLLPDHRIRLEVAAGLPVPATAVTLIASLVRFVLTLDPYLDRLESERASCPSGREKIWPG